MKHERTGSLRVRDAVDGPAAVTLLRVPLRRQNHGDRSAPRRVELNTGDIAARRRGERFEEIAVEQRDDGLRLGIAEPAVELETRAPSGVSMSPA